VENKQRKKLISPYLHASFIQSENFIVDKSLKDRQNFIVKEEKRVGKVFLLRLALECRSIEFMRKIKILTFYDFSGR
jgi:hypothetical protein